MGNQKTISRRQFIVTSAAVGGGMAIGLLPRIAAAATHAVLPWGKLGVDAGIEFTPWIAIAADDTVTVRVAPPEIGNGVLTQVAQLVAEELHCAWAKVRTEYAPAHRDYVENGVYDFDENRPFGYFAGRSTARERMQLMLQVGASGRERLKAAAAAQWGVDVGEVSAQDSVLHHTPTGRTLRYGEVAERAGAITLDAEPAPKPQSAWTLLGKTSPAKLNLPQIVNGSAIYGIDVRVPGMVYAALRQSPVHGGRLKAYDADAVMAMPGVLAVVAVDPDERRGTVGVAEAPFGLDRSKAQSAVAVVAEHYWQARKALAALPMEWQDGAGGRWKTSAQVYETAVAALDRDEGGVVEKSAGDVSGLKAQKTFVEGIYVTPYSDQSPMEPLNGTALVTPDRVDVWHPSQHSKQAFWVAVNESEVPPEKVFMHQTMVGGGFGRRLFADDVRMVVAIAKKLPGRAVQVLWSREETMRQGRYRTMVAAKLQAGLGEDGMPNVLITKQVSKGHSPRMANTPYARGTIPNVLVEAHEIPLHILTGAYRGPGYNSYAFMLETFIDECAEAAGIDPLEYRLELLKSWPDPGWHKVLHEVAAKSAWGKRLPKGMGQGLAIANWGMMNGKPQTGTTVAIVTSVEVTKTGVLKIHEIDVAFDTGRVLNRDAVLHQMQGGVIFGLNMALNEEINVTDGRIVEGNFDEYAILRMGDTPKVNVHFGGLSGHDRFSEVGEPPVGPVGPAVGNAIYRATGKRIRSTPILKHDLSWG